VGYYPEPILLREDRIAKTLAPILISSCGWPRWRARSSGWRRCRCAGKLGLGGLLACLDELAIAPGHKGVEGALMQATVGKARGLGARRIVVRANEGTPPPRAAQLRAAQERAHLPQSA